MKKKNAYSNKIIPLYFKNLSRLTSRSFLLKLLIDGAETTVLDKLFRASIAIKNNFPTSILHVCLVSLKLLPHVTLEPGARLVNEDHFVRS